MFGALENINFTNTVYVHVHVKEGTCHPVRLCDSIGLLFIIMSYIRLLLHRQHLLVSINCWFGSFVDQKYGISLALSCKGTKFSIMGFLFLPVTHRLNHNVAICRCLALLSPVLYQEAMQGFIFCIHSPVRCKLPVYLLHVQIRNHCMDPIVLKLIK